MKVIAFNASAREDGNTQVMIDESLKELQKEGIKTESYSLAGKNIHGCRACYNCFKNKDKRCFQDDDIANECIAKMLEADGIIIASPSYFSDLSTEAKALIDRAGMVARANDNMFRRKAGAAISVARRAGNIHVFDSINHFFLISEMIIPGSSYWNIGHGRDKGEVRKDSEAIETMKTLGKNMAWLLKRISKEK